MTNDIIGSIISSVVTLIVGCVAYFVYRQQKRDEKRNAATIIVMDVRQAEQVVFSILEKGLDTGVDATSLKPIISENNWTRYKHLFVSDLSYDDFAAFNRFFDSCIIINEARGRMVDLLDATLRAKASIVQEKIFEIENLSTPEGQEKRQKIIEEINKDSHSFSPKEPQDRIIKSLELMGRLSNTMAFEKLRKRSGIKA